MRTGTARICAFKYSEVVSEMNIAINKKNTCPILYLI